MIYAISYTTENSDTGNVFIESEKQPKYDDVMTTIYKDIKCEFEDSRMGEDYVHYNIYPMEKVYSLPSKKEIQEFYQHCDDIEADYED